MRDELVQGECLAIMRGLPDNSIDALVTDPPAGVHFMSASWDHDKGGRRQWIAWLSEVMQEALRIVKPGGHALVWALPRTSHWTATALEDAGWEIRDCISSVFGSGFPKSKNLGNGWGSALKPAHEHWILARKPLASANLASNVLAWGTGGLNIDASRIPTADALSGGTINGPTTVSEGWDRPWRHDPAQVATKAAEAAQKIAHSEQLGRWPPNFLLSHSPDCVPVGTKRVKGSNSKASGLQSNGVQQNTFGKYGPALKYGYADEDGLETVEEWECSPDCPVRLLDEQAGDRPVSGSARNGRPATGNNYDYNSLVYGGGIGKKQGTLHNDAGGPSRFFPCFYAAKASRSERNLGCEGLPDTAIHRLGAGLGQGQHPEAPVIEGNHHPTVKSLALMRWLVRLITPPGGTVLDCFAGSGSTLVACVQEGFHYLGIEQDASYCEIARARVAHAVRHAPVARPQPQQTALSAKVIPLRRKKHAVSELQLSLFDEVAI